MNFSTKSSKFKRTFVSSLLLACLFSSTAQKIIHVRDFGVTPSVTADATEGVNCALSVCEKSANSILQFEAGEYHFWGNMASEKYCFVSNNDEGLKRIIFPLENVKNLTIDGNGARFVFHGMVNPFLVEESSEITFKNFSMDYDRTFHSEGIIIASNPNEMDLQFSDEFPFKVRNNILTFTGHGKVKSEKKTTVSHDVIYPYGSLLEYDTEKRETAYMACDYYINSIPLVAKQLSKNKVRIYLKNIRGTVGNTMVFGPATRNYPGFILTDSRDVIFDNVTIHHTGGMGIIGQRTHNIRVAHCKVIPSDDRIVSCTADATHFSNCTGKIELSHCTFIGQKDDATNIHGIYVKIIDQPSKKELDVKLVHAQQFGFDFLKKGVAIEYVEGKSLITQGTARVISVNRINKEVTRVKLDRETPAEICIGDVIGELRDFPEVHIHHNYIGKNRARGMLLNCRGKTLLEHNTFHSPGAAILFEGDACFWFEQGGVSDCVIRNNVFDNCLFGVWGKAIIDVGAGIHEKRDESRYNSNIRVYDNIFKVFDGAPLLHAYCMKGLRWYNNKIEHTSAYPPHRTSETLYVIEYCDDMEIE